MIWQVFILGPWQGRHGVTAAVRAAIVRLRKMGRNEAQHNPRIWGYCNRQKKLIRLYSQFDYCSGVLPGELIQSVSGMTLWSKTEKLIKCTRYFLACFGKHCSRQTPDAIYSQMGRPNGAGMMNVNSHRKMGRGSKFMFTSINNITLKGQGTIVSGRLRVEMIRF